MTGFRKKLGSLSRNFIAQNPFATAVMIIFVQWLIWMIWKSYLSSTILISSSIWEAFEHIVLTIAVILMFRGFENDDYFKRISSSYVDAISHNLMSLEMNMRDHVIPLSSHCGLKGVHEEIDFLKIFKAAANGSTIHIFFTFHKSLSDDLARIVSEMESRNIRCRMLIGNYEADSIVRRFEYIGWGKEELDRLRTFSESEVESRCSYSQTIISQKMMELKIFSNLPDIPIIIETAPIARTVLGEKINDYDFANIRRVLTGYYVLRPAVEGVLLEWQVIGEGSLAQSFWEYFKRRWADASATPRAEPARPALSLEKSPKTTPKRRG